MVRSQSDAQAARQHFVCFIHCMASSARFKALSSAFAWGARSRQRHFSVIFEKENINTGTMTSEMILTVLSAFAQAESESISQNVARGKRMGYRQGKFSFPYSCMIGYRKGPDGNPQIIPEQAETVRLIYNDYLAGDSLVKIAENLDARGIPTPKNKGKWSSQTVMRILQNEKYAGHVCCFSKRMRKVFRKNEKSMLQNCNKKAKRKGRLQRVKKPM